MPSQALTPGRGLRCLKPFKINLALIVCMKKGISFFFFPRFFNLDPSPTEMYCIAPMEHLVTLQNKSLPTINK